MIGYIRPAGGCDFYLQGQQRSARPARISASLEVERYKNLSGDSGVAQYQLSEGAVIVQFSNGSVYEYTDESAGAAAIATMQRLAVAGRGLSRFISTTVRDKYSRRIR